ncbi:hypothetical protein Cgig2_006714 [Carnegiea gigantea]|uniref:Uncharacterized protein n=1 Tax=Carnegiea gigantea TaxID=171969 RepID=A0A9Q1JSK6_9CARY|nr:hypothetical protein Cgig2_006714 [Carnegiea gigantea]
MVESEGDSNYKRKRSRVDNICFRIAELEKAKNAKILKMMFEVMCKIFFSEAESVEAKYDEVEFAEAKFDDTEAEFDEAAKELKYGENAINSFGLVNFLELSALQNWYKLRGLEIIGFPCYQFDSNKPNNLGHEFEAAFTIFEEACVKLFLIKGVEIKWNFEKVLIGKDGKITGSSQHGLLCLRLTIKSTKYAKEFSEGLGGGICNTIQYILKRPDTYASYNLNGLISFPITIL